MPCNHKNTGRTESRCMRDDTSHKYHVHCRKCGKQVGVSGWESRIN